MSATIYRGQRGSYQTDDPRPIAYGRVSVLLAGADKDGKKVALKVFREAPELKMEFAREIAAQQAMNHPNILPVLDYGENAGPNAAPFLVMPFCEGGSLRQLMQGRDFLAPAAALNILDQIALAVDYAHQNGLVHGDIKPENILFPQQAMHACLSDFGAAKYFPVIGKISTATAAEHRGTMTYLSPEEIQFARQSPASDIYAFAVVAYEMFTGKYPFKIDAPLYQLLTAKVEGKVIDPVEFNHHLPAAVKQALLAGLRVDPKQRPASARDFCRMLREEMKPSAAAVAPENAEAEPAPGKSRGFWPSLSATQKVAIISALITAAVAIVTAVINIIPELVKK